MDNKIENFKKEWGQAIVSGDPESALKLYHRDAILKPTLSAKIRRGLEEIRPYFVDFCRQGIEQVLFKQSWQQQLADAWVLVGHYQFVKKEGSIDADYTFVVSIKENSETLEVLAHHSSLTYSP